MMSLNDTVADDRPLTPQWGTPDDPSPRLHRDDPDGLNDTSACTSNLKQTRLSMQKRVSIWLSQAC